MIRCYKPLENINPKVEEERDKKKPTSFLTIYDSFFSRVTDDMFMELIIK